MKNSNPLVSCPVITYNSSKYVIETLDSVYNQTYQNIELIISDDCSPDNTVQICRDWLETHKDRFVRTQLIESPINTGVSANLNRAEAACQGEWCKGIAGDDIMFPNCVQDCVDYVNAHEGVICLFGRMQAFGGTEEQNKWFNQDQFDYSFFQLNSREQYNVLVTQGDKVYAPTCFVNLSEMKRAGIRNDVRIRDVEDWPKWINLTRHGIKLYACDCELVKYRIRQTSLSTDVLSPRFRHAIALVWLYYCFKPQLKVSRRNTILGYIQVKCYLSNNSLFWRLLRKAFHLFDFAYCKIFHKTKMENRLLNPIVRMVIL